MEMNIYGNMMEKIYLKINRDLIIYEIFLADFTEDGKYTGNK